MLYGLIECIVFYVSMGDAVLVHVQRWAGTNGTTLDRKSRAGDGAFLPDYVSYNNLMTICSISKRGAQAAQPVLDLLQGMLPKPLSG
jgi:hypothetical protein